MAGPALSLPFSGSLLKLLLAVRLVLQVQASILPLRMIVDNNGGVREESSFTTDAKTHARELPLCIDGRAVPRLFLLGQQKCGTTTMALDMENAGAVFFAPDRKESHMFDEVCGYSQKTDFDGTLSGCTHAMQSAKSTWLRSLEALNHRSCFTPERTILEATPANSILPNLPVLLSSLYGNDASRLGFVILYREPLARMQSNWYMAKQFEDRNMFMQSFKGYLTIQEPSIKQYKARNFSGIEMDAGMNYVYRSLYSLSLAPWLGSFSPSQFVIVPLSVYLNSTSSRDAVMSHLAKKFSATLFPSDLGLEQAHRLSGEHPPLEDDVDHGTVKHWYEEYFLPDLKQLAVLLAENVPSGLDVAGYSGGPSTSSMFDYLCTALGCLL